MRIFKALTDRAAQMGDAEFRASHLVGMALTMDLILLILIALIAIKMYG